MNFYTYILICDNKRYYVGHTNNLKFRYERHLNKSGAKFTTQNIPTRILWQQEFDTEIESIKREKQIKGWSRKKKENLIKGVWN